MRGLPLGVVIQVLALVGVAVVVCVVLFAAGLLRPGRSRRMQDGVARASVEAEQKSGRRGRVGQATESSLRRRAKPLTRALKRDAKHATS